MTVCVCSYVGGGGDEAGQRQSSRTRTCRRVQYALAELRRWAQ